LRKLSPPPSIVDLVTNSYDDDKVIDKSKADSIWKKWIANLVSFLTPEDWREVDDAGQPAFENNWANYTASSAYNTAAFYKDPFGRVWLKGTIEDTAGTGVGTVIFTLPSDYIPAKTEIHICIGTGNAIQRVDIQSNGDVYLRAGDGSGHLSLDGISFRAA